jgi:hypothetical protein
VSNEIAIDTQKSRRVTNWHGGGIDANGGWEAHGDLVAVALALSQRHEHGERDGDIDWRLGAVPALEVRHEPLLQLCFLLAEFQHRVVMMGPTMVAGE